MKRNPAIPFVIIMLSTAFTGLLAVRSTATSAATPAAQAAGAAAAQLATINTYCVGCHNDRSKTGGVSFEGLKVENIGERADLFEKAVRKLRGRVMPPPGARQPEAKGYRFTGVLP
jgi:mono/diheme cytochrome c family protein